MSDIGVIDCLCRVRPELLTRIAKLGQQAFNCLFHFIAAMVGTNGNFAVDLAVCRGDTLQTDMALAREIRGERGNERRFIDPEGRTDNSASNIRFGDERLVSEIGHGLVYAGQSANSKTLRTIRS